MLDILIGPAQNGLANHHSVMLRFFGSILSRLCFALKFIVRTSSAQFAFCFDNLKERADGMRRDAKTRQQLRFSVSDDAPKREKVGPAHPDSQMVISHRIKQNKAFLEIHWGVEKNTKLLK